MDYVKEDSCNATGNHTAAFAQYGLMRDALNATGRRIYFDLCGWFAKATLLTLNDMTELFEVEKCEKQLRA